MNTTKVSATLARPANTTAYTAGDVFNDGATPGARFVFSGLPGFSGEGYEIHSALLIDDADQATKPDLELWLFDTDITDLDTDNATWTPTDAQLKTAVGVIQFATANFKGGDLTAGAGGNCACWVNNVAIAAK